MGFCFLLGPRWCYLATLILIGLVILLIDISSKAYYFYLGDSLISWKVRNKLLFQVTIQNLNIMYLPMLLELRWLHSLLTGMGVLQQSPTILHYDNHSTTQIVDTDIFINIPITLKKNITLFVITNSKLQFDSVVRNRKSKGE